VGGPKLSFLIVALLSLAGCSEIRDPPPPPPNDDALLDLLEEFWIDYQTLKGSSDAKFSAALRELGGRDKLPTLSDDATFSGIAQMRKLSLMATQMEVSPSCENLKLVSSEKIAYIADLFEDELTGRRPTAIAQNVERRALGEVIAASGAASGCLPARSYALGSEIRDGY